jgi:peptide-methionine (S)-S-oxide reductase
METATFGNGCFWCTEAVFQELKGVKSVVSGYSGGHVDRPTYEQVCTGRTGHAEVCQIEYDPKVISYKELLEVFFNTHDPTTLNRQGNDVGAQYRSVIFYRTEEERETAERMKTDLDKSGKWKNPIVTQIVAFERFFPAEDYHQNYYRSNPNQGYCRYVIKPKVDKFEKVFKLKLGP